MTPKRIEFSEHAIDDMQERGFRREDVRWILAQGHEADVVTRWGETRYAKAAILRNREGKVVYLENNERILVISVQWVLSKGALARQKKGTGRRKGKKE